MDNGKNTFCLKMQREMRAKTKGMNGLKDMTMFMLYNPILLGCINAKVLISGAILSKKILYRKNSPPLSMRIFAMDALNWILTKEKKIVSKFCV
jgi:hypothetical protein